METTQLDDSQAPPFTVTLSETLDALGPSAGRYCLIGGVASAVYGRQRWTHDIDVLCRPADAHTFLQLLADRGFETEETNPHWIFKAIKGDVQVDVIFAAKGDVMLDQEMSDRIQELTFDGVTVPVVPPEDLVVMKAVADDESSNRHWHDALGVLRQQPLDWDYLVERARRSPHRVLSLLHYALSSGVVVPLDAVRQIHTMIDESWR